MNLLVGIPAFNEELTIAEVIAKIPHQVEGVDTISIVVVDDGSTDETAEIARASGATVVRHPSNLSVGVAFQTLVREALRRKVDVLVTLDADGQFNPGDIPKIIAGILSGHYDVCTASRFVDPKKVPNMPWIKKWGNHRVARLVSRLSGREFHDVSCGFRAYSREALLRLTVHHSFTYTHETLLDLAAKHVRIYEVPLVVRGTREFGQSRVASSILRYAWRASTIMLRFYRDHYPVQLCAWLAIIPFLFGVGLFSASLGQWLSTGNWIKWAAFSSAACCGFALAMMFFGFLADMASRLRRNQEEILYWLRRAGNDGLHEKYQVFYTRQRIATPSTTTGKRSSQWVDRSAKKAA